MSDDSIESNYQCAACNGRPPPHGVLYDRLGWVCSVCGGWNHVQDRFCTHTHALEQPLKASLPIVTDRAQVVDCPDCEDGTAHQHAPKATAYPHNPPDGCLDCLRVERSAH